MNANTNTEQLYKDNILGNYGLPPITFVRGRGLRLWDDLGKEYLDFCSGIAVTSLGHCHPKLVAAIQEQANDLICVSNLYRNEVQARLAAKINAKAGGNGKVFFCNSGAEANETLIKLARLYGYRKSGQDGKQCKIVCAKNAFHGRTFGCMSATPKENVRQGFAPLVDGFAFAELNDIDSFASVIDGNTAAVFIETIQGEGGIYPAERQFLKDLHNLCSEREVLLMIDEVQCGVGRTGRFFAFEHAGIEADAIGMAKGLGGGVPIGGVWVSDQYAELFKPGSHGTTFGGTPLISAAALTVIETIEDDGLLENVIDNGAYVMQRLAELKSKYPHYISDVRGLGFMIGIQIAESPAEVVTQLRDDGLIVPPAGSNVVRFLPALTATKDDFDEALRIFESVVENRSATLPETQRA
ncbi:MAG: aspartate aminotransferase family protein [Verrucomicrobiota bacterium]|nr:aspartate aminotransferase family protein [Verrucomicrobiota bacterium]